MKKNLDIKALIAAAAALVGMIFYFVSYNTYPSAAVNTPVGMACGCAALVLMAICAVTGKDTLRSLLIVASGLLLVVFFYQFAMGRVSVTADIYFIPVNHPAEENAAMTQTIIGVAATVVSFLMLVIDGFTAKD